MHSRHDIGVLDALDRFAIQDVIARYNNSCDDFDLDDALSLVTDDAEVTLYVNNGDQPLLQVVGPAQIRKALEPRHLQHQAIGIQVHHLIQNLELVHADSAEVELRCQVLVLYQRVEDPGKPAPQPVQSGWYHYRMRRTDCGWRIAGVVASTCGVYDAHAIFDV
jgi:hypothetical protein